MNTKPPSLAILTPRWGATSETFIRQHLTKIAPGKTVAMARDVSNADWCTTVPLLPIKTAGGTPAGRLARAIGLWPLDIRSRTLRRFLTDHQVTVIMGEWLNFAAGWYPSLRGLNIPFFAHAHGYDITAKKLAATDTAFSYRHLRRMEGVITVSEAGRQRLLKRFDLNPERLHVIPCGVEVPVECPVRQKSSTVTCVSVGRMVPKKNPLATLKAFELARKDAPDLNLELVGDGPLFDACQRFCMERELSPFVKFHGSQPSTFVKDLLRRADIFLLHSIVAPNGDEEGLPVSILEAMAAGLPVVSTLHAGIPEAVIQGSTGWLVAEGDFQAMSQGILELVRQPRKRVEMGTAGWTRAGRHFSIESEIKQLQTLLLGKTMPSSSTLHN